MNRNFNIKSFLDTLKNKQPDYIEEPKIKEISIAPRMTSTMPLPFNKPAKADRIYHRILIILKKKKRNIIFTKNDGTMPMPFNNKPNDRILDFNFPENNNKEISFLPRTSWNHASTNNQPTDRGL